MFPIISAVLPFTGMSLANLVPSIGMWVYLLVFLVILFASTIVGGAVPDNTFLFLLGAVGAADGLSLEWLLAMAIAGGFAGYEINYWSGRIVGLAIVLRRFPGVLEDKNVQKALGLMDTFAPVTFFLSRTLPVLNLPSFIFGVNAMNYRRYVVYNLTSSMLWCGFFMALGNYIGGITFVSVYLGYIADLFLIVLLATILVGGVVLIREYRIFR